MKIFAASAGGLRPKDTRGHFFLPEEGGFGAFSVSSARGFLCGRSALKYKRENRNFLYQTLLFRFLGFCLPGGTKGVSCPVPLLQGGLGELGGARGWLTWRCWPENATLAHTRGALQAVVEAAVMGRNGRGSGRYAGLGERKSHFLQ